MTAHSPVGVARIASVNLAECTGVAKNPVEIGTLLVDEGFEGDAHQGPGLRQVSMLTLDAVERMKDAGADVSPGSFGENLTVEGIDPSALPLGTRLAVGPTAILSLSQHGKVCHDRCAIYHQVGDCVMPREGTFASVEQAGDVRPGDPISILGMGTDA